MHQESIQELIKEHKQSTYQLTYYLMAVSTACIGFTIHFITNHRDQKLLYLLFSSVLFWAISFYNGYKRLDNLLEYVRGNIVGLEVLDEMRISGGKEIIEGKLSSINKRQQRNYKWQVRFLGIGLFMFMCWLVFDIYFKK